MEIFVGSIISLFVQAIKKYIAEKWRLPLVCLLAIIAGLIQWYLKSNEALLQNIVAIFSYASGFYLLILKNLQKK